MRRSTIVVFAALCFTVTSLSVPRKSIKDNHGLLKQNKSNCLEGSNDLDCVCGPCKSVVGFLRLVILEHKTQDEELLQKACLRFYRNDPTRKAFCEKVVAEHLDMMLDFVRQKIDPADVCKLFC